MCDVLVFFFLAFWEATLDLEDKVVTINSESR